MMNICVVSENDVMSLESYNINRTLLISILHTPTHTLMAAKSLLLLVYFLVTLRTFVTSYS